MSTPASPFHAGERRVQTRLGVADKMAALGPRVIRDHLIEQHREFFATQHMLLLGRVDGAGWPWASLLAGPPGFAHSPAPDRMHIAAMPVGGAPQQVLVPGQRVGLLGIDYATRRRNRVNGRIAAVDGRSFELAVEHSFGNCPKYIHKRAVSLAEGRAWHIEPGAPMRIATLAGAPGDLIDSADHFYIASHHGGDWDDARHGVDVSHRGGRTGFVRVRDNAVIEFPDFAGNRFFNTLGNIEASGRAGLLVIDVRDGSLLACSGRATIDWRAASAARLPGAERIVRIEVEHAWQHARALPWQWRLVESSPALEGTGVWPRGG